MVTLYSVTITLFDVTGNPFVYGEVVPAAAFADRVVELDRLVRDLAAAQKVFLISPRRYGKSSLIRLALAAMAGRRVLTVDVTVSSFSSYLAFLEGYARALAAAEARAGSPARLPRWGLPWLRESIASTRVDIGPDSRAGRGAAPGPGPRVAFPNARTDRDVSRLAEEVFALPARLAESSGRTVVVAADEFPAFVDSRFSRSGMKPEPGLGAAIVDLAGNLPYDVQRLAHETWDAVRGRNRRRATLDDLHQALRRLLVEQQMMFEAIW